MIGLHLEGGLFADPRDGSAFGDDGEESGEFFKDEHVPHGAVIGLGAGLEEISDGFGVNIAGVVFIDAEATVDGRGAIPEDRFGHGPAFVGELAVAVTGDEIWEAGILFPPGLGRVAEEVRVLVELPLVGDVAKSLALHRSGQDSEHGLKGGLGFASIS